ncbi:Asp23/Gls24 family envelope stress response protein [Streptomyces sp. NPDC005805]|uniref:Asp23/Gls24 family envelope stress response protein n=1 Tax=Streptomyces sp. NPDC005805 TaxID=3157068 RepID=UPI0033F59C9E
MEVSGEQGRVLPCGRDTETVWRRTGAGNGRATGPLDAARAGDGHDPGCAHCAAVEEGFAVLRAATDELVAERVRPSAGLTGRIMSAVRAERRRRHLLVLPTGEPGQARISEQAVASVLRSAADSVEGVRARHCRVAPAGAEDGAEDGAVRVELCIAVRYRGFRAEAVAEVRERVRAAAAARIGVPLARLDLTVEDVHDH